MPISITITADDPTEVQGWARILLGMTPGEIDGTVQLTASAAEVLQRAVDSEANPNKGGRPRGSRTKKDEHAETPAAPAEKPIEGEVLPPDNGPQLTADDLREEMKRISADHGIEATRKLLARMGVEKLGQIEPSKYPEFMTVAKTWTGV